MLRTQCPGLHGLLRFGPLTLMLGLAGCGAVRGAPPAIDRGQDERILREVEARIAADAALASQSIRVEVDGAKVTLYGSVAGIDAWNCALRTAQLVEGVTSVVEYLIIERGPRISSCGVGSPR